MKWILGEIIYKQTKTKQNLYSSLPFTINSGIDFIIGPKSHRIFQLIKKNEKKKEEEVNVEGKN